MVTILYLPVNILFEARFDAGGYRSEAGVTARICAKTGFSAKAAEMGPRA